MKKRLSSILLGVLVIIFVGCANSSTAHANSATCNKNSNNNNGVLSGNVTCSFSSFTGNKQVSFDLQNKPKPQQLTINYNATVSSGTVVIKLKNASGSVYYEKTLTKSGDQATFNLSLLPTEELLLDFTGTNAKGNISFNW
ncbi:hypothetical protein YSY43_28640 [Paenibacillus sp. YSY-4.3]